MATPEFIVSLRQKIGHEQLWLPGVSIIVVDDAGRLLLGRRADNGQWAVVSGIPEPGEQPATAIRRECLEETGVDVEILALIGVEAGQPISFPNGDNCVFMDINFVGRPRPGTTARACPGWPTRYREPASAPRSDSALLPPARAIPSVREPEPCPRTRRRHPPAEKYPPAATEVRRWSSLGHLDADAPEALGLLAAGVQGPGGGEDDAHTLGGGDLDLP